MQNDVKLPAAQRRKSVLVMLLFLQCMTKLTIVIMLMVMKLRRDKALSEDISNDVIHATVDMAHLLH